MPPYFEFPSGYGGGKLPTYLMFFIVAYILASDHRFMESVDRNKLLSLVLAVITSGIVVLWALTFGDESIATAPRYVVVMAGWAFNGWCWIVAIIGYGRGLNGFKLWLLALTGELVLPFYILHQTVIVSVAYIVVGFEVAPYTKYLLVLSLSFLATGLILVVVRQLTPLRLLMGMKEKQSFPKAR